MITARTTRLVRAADLRAFHRAIAACLPAGPAAARDCAVIVPSRSAAEELQRTIEHLGGEGGTPDIVTRDELYSQLHERMPGAPGNRSRKRA